MSVTYGGKTPAYIAFGRRTPDVLQVPNMGLGQLSVEMLREDGTSKDSGTSSERTSGNLSMR
eukprot:11901489-Prorocentrum_lima.AAC.1